MCIGNSESYPVRKSGGDVQNMWINILSNCTKAVSPALHNVHWWELPDWITRESTLNVVQLHEHWSCKESMSFFCLRISMRHRGLVPEVRLKSCKCERAEVAFGPKLTERLICHNAWDGKINQQKWHLNYSLNRNYFDTRAYDPKI